MTIEPGVVIQADNDILIEIRGTLLAGGTITDSIKITSSSASPTLASWKGIWISNNLGGNASFKFCAFEYGMVAIHLDCCWNGGPVSISRSSFQNNLIALGGYAGWIETIDSCQFEFNKWAVTEADKRISNSTFRNNIYGIGDNNGAGRMNVFNSYFCGNDVAIYIALYSDTLQNCVIVNNHLGYKADDGFGKILDNIIAENDTGILTSSTSEIYTNNVICSNHTMNVIYTDIANKNMIGNCWCETDSAIIETKIYDGYDNVAYGLIAFSPVIICDSSAVPPISNCNPSPLAINDPTGTKNIFYRIYPNPFSQSSVFEFQNPENDKHTLLIYNLYGQLIRSYHDVISGQVKIERGDLSPGMYFFQLIKNQDIVATGKFVAE